MAEGSAPIHPGDSADFPAPRMDPISAAMAAVTRMAMAVDAVSDIAPAERRPDPAWPDVMIDIETMATHSSRALILSVGLIPFELRIDAPAFGVPFLILPDLAHQLLDGRVVDPGTQTWWKRQKPEAAGHWLDPRWHERQPEPAPTPLRMAPGDACDEITLFLDQVCAPDVRVWANGAVFDIGNLENLFHSQGVRPPWKYNAVRDYRTVSQILPRVRDRARMDAFTAHDPVSDCRMQIWRLWEHWLADQFPAQEADAGPAGGWKVVQGDPETHAVRSGHCPACGIDLRLTTTLHDCPGRIQ